MRTTGRLFRPGRGAVVFSSIPDVSTFESQSVGAFSLHKYLVGIDLHARVSSTTKPGIRIMRMLYDFLESLLRRKGAF